MLYICGLNMSLVKKAFIAFVAIFPLIWFFVLHSYQKCAFLCFSILRWIPMAPAIT